MDNLQSVPIDQNIQDSVDSLSGLTINDLNKYLPALQTAEDLFSEIDLEENLINGIKYFCEKEGFDLAFSKSTKKCTFWGIFLIKH